MTASVRGRTRAPTAAVVFAALADPTRRALVERLARGPQSVSTLAAPLRVTLTAVGQHVRVLAAAGLVRTQKVGRVRTCRLGATGFAALEHWLHAQRARWEERLDRLGDVLAEDDDSR